MTEAKRAITEADQLINKNSSTDDFYTVSSNTAGRNGQMSTPPPHTVKS